MAFIVPEDILRERASLDGITDLSTGIAIIRDGSILVVRREPADFLGGNFELPGGGVDAGETLAGALKREAFEETGLTVVRILGMFPGFDYSTPKKPKVRQFNFLVEAKDDAIVLSAEHDQWRWVTRSDLADLAMSPEIKQSINLALKSTGK